MHKMMLIINGVIVFFLINFAIYQKKQMLKEGEIVLLEIQPTQKNVKLKGDYLTIQYVIEKEMSNTTLPASFHQGYAVIRADKDSVAHFVRIFQGETLANNEKLLRFFYRPRAPIPYVVKPNTFFFQERNVHRYTQAYYAIFHYHGQREYLLIGVADKNKKPL